MTTTTNVQQVKLNVMTEAQYTSATKNANEFYAVTDAKIPVSDISGLATVATSGSYNDLSNQPTIPTVNDATLTITQGGTTKGTFTANASSDVTVDLDSGGSSRNIGEIVQSTIPLTDAGLHLLDGGVISGSGAYSDFVTYIAGLVSSYPNCFCSEADWQTAVSTYGVCGKFVYDSVNGTVRLPKITGFTEGTIDPTTLGDLTEAGLPNIAGTIKCGTAPLAANEITGLFTNSTYTGGRSSSPSSGNSYQYEFDASKSNTIYGNSTTVQPQSIKVLYYIVISTSTKTQIEVDIDEVMTDLNGKVSISDLATCHVVIETWHSGTEWYRVYDDGWCEQGGLAAVTNGQSGYSVALHKNYADVDYQVIVSPYGSAYSTYGYGAYTFTTNGFKIYCSVNTERKVFWQACGYIS